VGSLVVFAIAALTGTIIGGVSVYLINDAVSLPPSVSANSNPTPAVTDRGTTSTPAPQQAPAATNGRPVRMVDPAFPPASPTESKPAAPAATATATQPPAENPVSSAAIPAQPTASQPPAPAPPQSPSASAAASQPMPQDNLQTTAHDGATHEAATPDTATPDAATQAAAPETSEHTSSPRKAARKRVTNARPPASQSSSQATDQAQSTTRRTVYDYYDRDNDQQRASATEPDSGVRTRLDPRDPRLRRSLSQAQQRIIVRRQDNYDRDDRYGRDDRDDQADRRFPAQPRPAQSFFGFFGDRHDDNDRD
jgi:hypothetical protein